MGGFGKVDGEANLDSDQDEAFFTGERCTGFSGPWLKPDRSVFSNVPFRTCSSI